MYIIHKDFYQIKNLFTKRIHVILDIISDLHGHYPKLHGGDILIIAGDLTGRNSHEEYLSFSRWVKNQDYKHKIVISGNHDKYLYDCYKNMCNPFKDKRIDYLCDTSTTVSGLKIHGSPWTPKFYNWYFMKERGEDIKKMWDMIPNDTDILVTHGPPYGILDDVNGKPQGCEELRIALERVKPKVHAFGHIHEQGGQQILFKHSGPNTICVNASLMNESYKPVNKPIRVIL